MKKLFSFVIVLVIFFSYSQVYAQNGKAFSFGFGLEGGGIVGDKDFKQAYGGQGGLSLRFAYKVGPGYVTFTPGASLVLPKKIDGEDIELGTHIPLKLGYKYIFLGKLFVMAEGGYSFYNFYSTSTENEDVDLEDIEKYSTKGFTYAPTVGVNLGKLEIGVRYETTILKKEKINASLLALRLGFNF